MTSPTRSDLSSSISPKAQDRSTTSGKPPTGGNIPANDTKSILDRDRAPGGDLAVNGSRSSGSPQAGSSVLGGDSSFGASQTAGSGNGNGNGSGSGSEGLQCIQHCEIPKLRDLQDRDGGKDRLRIRIAIDPNGLVIAATISKSSDNPQIDTVVLEGIKQMQFKPSGKTIKGIIKANILL
jgi:TonB family protein